IHDNGKSTEWGSGMDLSTAYGRLVFPFFLLCNGAVPAVAGHGEGPSRASLEGRNHVVITILYDNNAFDPRLKTAWGFSCLVRGLEKTILFDTGGDGRTLFGNMKQLGVDPHEVDIVVLSHIHGDHTGGLAAFLESNSRVAVYLPGSFPGEFKNAVRFLGAVVEEITEAREILPGVYSTGDLGDGIREQALALKTGEGLAVITGCAHPGIVRMVRAARDISGEDRISLVVGGFHLGGESPLRIGSIAAELRGLSVGKVAPCHCSGDETRRLFREHFKADYIESGVGKRIQLPGLSGLTTSDHPVANPGPGDR
ncbi:MAG: MBL fold metallo-hydrolase, partial [Deltaproteobacteria bacterium]|nr:MBL fold metallo-hydrolase [Deltaproteobacteria bacterium]